MANTMKNQQIPRVTKTEALIMQILLEKAGTEIYGWELMEKSDGSLKRGTIYVILNRMEDKGYIKSRKEPRRNGARGLPRRMYKLTGMGQNIINAWEIAQNAFVLGGGLTT